MPSPSTGAFLGARLSVVYENDLDGATAALLAVLRGATPASAEPEATGAGEPEDKAAA